MNPQHREPDWKKLLEDYLYADLRLINTYNAAGAGPQEQVEAEVNLKKKREAAESALNHKGSNE